jgi:hypothetical protein
MKKFFTSKKGLVLLGTMVVAVAAAIGAYAYFTSTGTGTGSATVGTSTAWTLGQTGTTGPALLPDASIGTGNIQTKAYDITNPSLGNQNLAQVDVSVAMANGSAWSSQTDPLKPACSKDDFSVGGAATGGTYTDTDSAGDFLAGETRSDTVSVQMIDNNANQDNCKGVTVPLYFSAS